MRIDTTHIHDGYSIVDFWFDEGDEALRDPETLIRLAVNQHRLTWTHGPLGSSVTADPARARRWRRPKSAEAQEFEGGTRVILGPDL